MSLTKTSDTLSLAFKSVLELSNTFIVEKNLALKERLEKLKVLRSLLENNRSEIVGLISSDSGKLMHEGDREIDKCLSHVHYYEKNLIGYMDQFSLPTTPDTKFISRKIYPAGVLLKFVPFNYPIWLAYKFIVPNLCIGNTILIRPPSTCSRLYLFFQDQLQRLAYNNIQICFTEENDSQELIAHKLVAGVSFTGSVTSG